MHFESLKIRKGSCLFLVLFIFVYIFEPCDPVHLMKTLALISQLTRDERGGAGERHVELGGERGQKHRRHSKVLAAANPAKQ
jgi:hypothetical protein